jgi:large subunit ribosomal protein L18
VKVKLTEKQRLWRNRRYRIRKKVKGTSTRPRLTLCLTHQHVYAQIVNDETGRTLFFLSTLAKDIRGQHLKPNREGAAALGKIFGERVKAHGIERVVLDRAGRRYHGCVKAFAEGVRALGIDF